MQTKLNKIILATVLILTANLTVLSQEVLVRETITQALADETIDRNAVKKLVITGEIEGTGYSDESEWSMFRFLDTTFPNIEEVELLTSQDFLDASYGRSLFRGALWLKRFSAPHTKYVGNFNFAGCRNLEEIYFPSLVKTGYWTFAYTGVINVELPELVFMGGQDFQNCYFLETIKMPKVKEIGSDAFYRCYNLKYADFPEAVKTYGGAFDLCSNMVWANLPKINSLEHYDFGYCRSLENLKLGTDFETFTEIRFGFAVLGHNEHETDTKPEFIELTLGEYVLPKANGNIWQSDNASKFSPEYFDFDTDYIWKIIHTVGIKELIKDISVEVYPNPATEYTTLSFSLEKPCYLEINLFDIKGNKIKSIYNGFAMAELFLTRINTDNLTKGAYFVKISIDKDYIIKKIIKN